MIRKCQIAALSPGLRAGWTSRRHEHYRIRRDAVDLIGEIPAGDPRSCNRRGVRHSVRILHIGSCRDQQMTDAPDVGINIIHLFLLLLR